MTIVRHSQAVWEGDLKSGKGHIDFGSGAFSGPYSFKARLEETSATNPEELIAAAHAGCFSMALSAELTKQGCTSINVYTKASVSLDQNDDGFYISSIHLYTRASAKGIDDTQLQKIALGAKKNCPISKALSSVDISLTFNNIKL